MTLRVFDDTITRVNMPLRRYLCKGAFGSILFLAGCSYVVPHGKLQRTDTTMAWREGTNVLWQFSFDPQKGKPFFHPIATEAGVPLTNFKPQDHPWHYGLWFSWKYINYVNYWEEDRTTGRAEGATRWDPPVIKTHDGVTWIDLNLTYTNPTGHVDMIEKRRLEISQLSVDGSYTIEWQAEFTAGDHGAVLDRTPMPGEPNGQVNGGYAGLGARLASAPINISFLCSTGAVDHFVSDRARPNAAAIACNFSKDSQPVGSIAIFSDPANAGENAPWYFVNTEQMRFVCPAILAPKALTLKANEKLRLHYRIVIGSKIWTPEALRLGGH